MEKIADERKNFGMCGKNFCPLKWYTDRKFFGDGGGGCPKKISGKKKFSGKISNF
jgi:hypothetical protein